VVAANKIDAVDDEHRVRSLEGRAKELGLPFFRISGVSGEGVGDLLETVWRLLAAERESSKALVTDGARSDR
jgi:predicted GTPase